MTTPADPRDRFLDDFTVGEVFEYGTVSVSEQEIIEFGRRFDPQTFHVDPAGALDGPFGGVIAVGWHTCAMGHRLMVDNFLSPANCLGSPGVDRLRLPAPVRPGAQLRTRITIAGVKPSASKPDRGVLTLDQDVLDARVPAAPVTVMALTGMMMWRRR